MQRQGLPNAPVFRQIGCADYVKILVIRRSQDCAKNLKEVPVRELKSQNDDSKLGRNKISKAKVSWAGQT